MGDNYKPIVIGQLKHTFKQAVAYMNDSIVGGAGRELNEFVVSLDTDSSLNYKVANLGQFKFLTKKIYKRLLAVGFDTKQNLIDHGIGSGYISNYPWDSSTPVSQNYKPAIIGQLKLAFSFSLPIAAPRAHRGISN